MKRIWNVRTGKTQTPAEAEAERREIQRTYALENGFFWMPCPLCRRDFGGHEWGDIGELPSIVGCKAICPTCTAQGRGVVIPDYPPEE